METKLALNLELDKTQLYWKQRARANWLRHGDQNSAFFHHFPSQRKRRNRILFLNSDQGIRMESEMDIHTVARDYFMDIFSSIHPDNFEQILASVSPCISTAENDILMSPFDKKEVYTTLQAMGPLKAAGADGLGEVFYQRLWHILGDEVADFCIGLLNGVYDMQLINQTHTVLIPKVSSPSNMTHYRPISLCNVIFKIASKMLANRLQKFLDICIDESQSAFIPGRAITDNVMIAYDILHSFTRNRMVRKGYFALKLDMSKAYDHVE
ncbi:hypothetical protein HRI_004708600 [Hibiscus trionum]|uniref:Reverse transcriptase domain-containing protein n=1 Tax=Hibiscus trionum TaxID=183268 RepID=A0A9W7JEV3_HIBTR|nr:hypothetical protein HRI_004708600 [Hibiscus trionum]